LLKKPFDHLSLASLLSPSVLPCISLTGTFFHTSKADHPDLLSLAGPILAYSESS